MLLIPLPTFRSPFKSGSALASRLCKAAMLHRFRLVAKETQRQDLLATSSYREAKVRETEAFFFFLIGSVFFTSVGQAECYCQTAFVFGLHINVPTRLGRLSLLLLVSNLHFLLCRFW